MQQRMGWVQHDFRQPDGWPEVGQMTTHLLAGLAWSRVAGAPESGKDLPSDRVIPVTERTPHSDGICAERTTPQHLVVDAEEDQGVFVVGKGGKARVAAEVARGPLPDIADELVHAKR